MFLLFMLTSQAFAGGTPQLTVPPMGFPIWTVSIFVIIFFWGGTFFFLLLEQLAPRRVLMSGHMRKRHAFSRSGASFRSGPSILRFCGPFRPPQRSLVAVAFSLFTVLRLAVDLTLFTVLPLGVAGLSMGRG